MHRRRDSAQAAMKMDTQIGGTGSLLSASYKKQLALSVVMAPPSPRVPADTVVTAEPSALAICNLTTVKQPTLLGLAR